MYIKSPSGQETLEISAEHNAQASSILFLVLVAAYPMNNEKSA